MSMLVDPMEPLSAGERVVLGRILIKLGLDGDPAVHRRVLAAAQGGTRQTIRVALLGAFRVSVGVAVVPDDAWRRRKAAAVVKLLALAPGHRMHREQMMDILWPELNAAAAGANLRKAVHHARAALDGACPGAGDVIVTAGDSLALRPDALEVDVDQFRSQLSVARRDRDIDGYRRALDLHQGELLAEDRYDEWAVGARRELTVEFLTGMAEMAALLEAGGDLRVATETVRLIIAADPTGDHGNAALMRLYALDWRRADALRHYGHFQQLLEQELGIEPGLATQRLYDEIRTGTLSALGPRRRCATGSATPRRCQAVPLSRQGVRPGARR